MKLRSEINKEQKQIAARMEALPEAVLIRILKKLPQQDRLASAALVCKTWAAAAAAATTQAYVTAVSASSVSGLGSWVQQHGRGVVQGIKVPHHRGIGVTLPLHLPRSGLPQLRLMQLNNCSLVFSSSSTEQRGAAIALPMLRHLSLRRCIAPLPTLRFLECPKLTYLHLCSPPFQQYAPRSDNQFDFALSALLQRLPALLSLSLGLDEASDAALAQLSSMQQLQHCELKGPCVASGVLAQLGSSLTSLTIRKADAMLWERDLPAASLPHLKQLKLAHISIEPKLLSRLTTLERLQLTACDLATYPLQGSDFAEAKAGAQQLLAALAQLTSLKQLDFTNIWLDALPPLLNPGLVAMHGDSEIAAVAAAQLSPFSALTASSQLESLKLAFRSKDPENLKQPLPFGAAEAMFPPGRQLTALTELVLDALHPTLLREVQNDQWCDSHAPDPFEGVGCLGGDDWRFLVAACPKLQRLTLNTVVPSWGALHLQHVLLDAKDQMQLSYLCLGGLCITWHVAAALADLKELRDLELHNTPNLDVDGLSCLTQLQQLSRLLLEAVGYRRHISLCLKSTSQTDPPDVWQQLQQQLPALREHQEELAMESDWDDSSEPYGSSEPYSSDWS